MPFEGILLPPREYERELRRVIQECPAPFEGVTDEKERQRKARNILMAQKVWERADYGLWADLRELIALRLAPWLERR